MEGLFPGLCAELAAEGVPVQDFGTAMRFLLPYGSSPAALIAPAVLRKAFLPSRRSEGA
ncbi:hypothetical protein [Streptomyces halobius]|uniref:Uncharacterized protein n=1 Tax=Streptomyces halobius TaxID=2879846 RepID=A0ABY4LZ97_9ACTN|nr:hypothetical protein [Streptomyces halobius]UQA90795.1 hypothetical protein K9S39_01845 [Streptomyces halobius]